MIEATSTKIPLGELNRLDRETFAARLKAIFEHSPWIAAAAWDARPFASLDALHRAMVAVMTSASRSRQLELIRAHPELASRFRSAGDLTVTSAEEQRGAGIDRLPTDVHARLVEANEAYRDRFGFPFVICVREHTIESILAAAERRLGNDPEREVPTALGEIGKIAALRLKDTVTDLTYEITYGKAGVPVYRQYATPLRGVPELPESAFRGRANALFANEITVEVFGDNFLPAYTHGDNSNVVATDSMKNFILREGLTFEGATLEGYLDHLGNGFLDRYPQMQGVRMSGRELPFTVHPVPAASGGFEPSGVLHQRQRSDYSTAELRYERDGDGWAIIAHRCGRVNMELLKTKGSAFTKFVRDEYTTLPDRTDRPLFIQLDVHWGYTDTADAIAADHSRYLAGEQVRDLCAVVFHELVSESIQELLHEMGTLLLRRCPQLASVELVGRNMTRDPYATSEDPEDDRKVFVPPFPAFGTITLIMRRGG